MLAIKRKDGGFSWMWLHPKADPEKEVAKWREIHGDNYISHEVVDDASAPTDWDFIEAWEPAGGKVRVNKTKAREFAHRVRRELRQQELAPLDAAVGANIPGVDVTALEAQREAIRKKYADLQNALDAAASVKAMRSLMIEARKDVK